MLRFRASSTRRTKKGGDAGEGAATTSLALLFTSAVLCALVQHRVTVGSFDGFRGSQMGDYEYNYNIHIYIVTFIHIYIYTITICTYIGSMNIIIIYTYIVTFIHIYCVVLEELPS